jgi:hypothetical protein
MSDTAQSYVIEVGEDQAGVIIKEAGEADFQFHAALLAYQALEGRRFANPLLAERAAIAHSIGRTRTRRSHNAYGRWAA